MSDLPFSPGNPSLPSFPGSPDGPCAPLSPGSPGGPTHTRIYIQAYSMKYSYVFRICLQNKDYQCFVSLDQHCWKAKTSVNMAKVNVTSKTLKIWCL